MSKFGDLIGGKKSAPSPAAPAQPTPVAVPSKPAEAIAPELAPEVISEEETKEETKEETEEETKEETKEETESDSGDISIDEMSKRELEEYARTVGLELDRRHSKSSLLDELKLFLESNS